MRQDWRTKSLEELCEFSNGLWIGKKPPFVRVGVIRNTNFTKDCKLDDSDIVQLDVERSQYAKRKLQYGDIILEKSGGGPKQPVGRVVIFDKMKGDFSFSNFTSLIRVKDPNEIDFAFLHRFLSFEYVSGATEQMQSHSTGIRNLKFEEYKQIKISFPSVAQQKRIVEIFDKAFWAIDRAKANVEKNLQNARELFESYLKVTFEKNVHGDHSEVLTELCELIVDCEHKTAPTQETGYASIRTPNIGKGHLILENVNRVSEETYKQWTRRAIPQAGDLILAREAPAGNVAVIPEGVKVCLGQRTVLIRPKKNMLNSKYLAFLLLSKGVQERLLSHSKGATVEHINMKDIRAFKIYNRVSVPEQEIIDSKFEILLRQTRKLEVAYQHKLNYLEGLRKCILQKGFTGELTAETEIKYALQS